MNKERLVIKPIQLDSQNVYGIEAKMESEKLNLYKIIKSALKLKQDLDISWKYKSDSFSSNFENYVKGWNASDEIYRQSKSNHKLLYLNIDLEDNGCTRRCSHCFTMAGQIDNERGRSKSSNSFPKIRKKLSRTRLINQIALAKEKLGLESVRILGRGEPTESPYLIEFIEQMASLDIVTVIFTRGHVAGNDTHTKKVFNRYGINSGRHLVKKLNELNASIILGYSALNDSIHDGMNGVYNHSKYSREGLKRFLQTGYRNSNPTRIGIETPIAKINISEIPVSYILFQCLGISPIFNTYMVTGRADQKFFESNTPAFMERLKLHTEVVFYMRQLGIKDKIGAYLGTKECHDISNGLYIPSSGDIRPCTGFESKQSIKGDLNNEDIIQIWERSKIEGEQSLCPPKINHGFPLNYEEQLEECIKVNSDYFYQKYKLIVSALNI